MTPLLALLLLCWGRACALATLTSPDRGAQELAWEAWLLLDAAASPSPARRITPKSVFVAPPLRTGAGHCAEGHRPDGSGRCVKVLRVDQAAQLDFLLSRLNAMYADNEPQKQTSSSSGPLQVSIPIAETQGPPMDDSAAEGGSVEVAVVLADVTNVTASQTMVAVWNVSGNTSLGGSRNSSSAGEPSSRPQENSPGQLVNFSVSALNGSVPPRDNSTTHLLKPNTSLPAYINSPPNTLIIQDAAQVEVQTLDEDYPCEEGDRTGEGTTEREEVDEATEGDLDNITKEYSTDHLNSGHLSDKSVADKDCQHETVTEEREEGILLKTEGSVVGMTDNPRTGIVTTEFETSEISAIEDGTMPSVIGHNERDVVYDGSDVVYDESDVVYGESDVIYNKSSVEHNGSSLVYDKSSVEHNGSSLVYDKSSVEHNGSSLVYDKSSVEHNGSSLVYDKSSVEHNGSSLVYDKSSVEHNGSSLVYDKSSVVHRDSISTPFSDNSTDRTVQEDLHKQTKTGTMVSEPKQPIQDLDATHFSVTTEVYISPPRASELPVDKTSVSASSVIHILPEITAEETAGEAFAKGNPKNPLDNTPVGLSSEVHILPSSEDTQDKGPSSLDPFKRDRLAPRPAFKPDGYIVFPNDDTPSHPKARPANKVRFPDTPADRRVVFPDEKRELFWWLPHGWRLNIARHRPMLVRFWAHLPHPVRPGNNHHQPSTGD
uniref:Uncharacterized protein n=1 Tax=Timema bartmani TaxID=61472 RepID=A0A7R9F177_9NEOP|nr:unnamed protein product [Timema bartmani]